jgi:hypothetical protein
MKIQIWSMLAITLMVLGVQQGLADEVVGTGGPNVATHIAPTGEPCVVSDVGHPSCCQRIWEWLTYRPLTGTGCSACCKSCEPCGMPPLYIFFLCDRFGHCGIAGPVGTPAPNGAQSQAGNQTQATANGNE